MFPLVKRHFSDDFKSWLKSQRRKLTPPMGFVISFTRQLAAMFPHTSLRIICLSKIDVKIFRSRVV